MAQVSGILNFVKGVDFNGNDFSGSRFPQRVELCPMTWFKINNCKLTQVPDALSRLTDLEHLQMAHNKLTNVHGELSDLKHLRTLIVRHNNIKTSGIPTDIFQKNNFSVIDFGHNQLREVPLNLEHAKGAITLNLSHNRLEVVPPQVLNNLIDLIYLDLSDNKIESLPPKLSRLTMIQVFKLSNNPLKNFSLIQMPSFKHLRVLHMRNTNRSHDNIPDSFEELVNLTEVDFAENKLVMVPPALYTVKNLRKLDLSENKIKSIALEKGIWEFLETLDVSSNLLTELPQTLVELKYLRRLYANNNSITFEGVPTGIGRLLQLTVLHLSFNQLEMIPEGICRCPKLEKLHLDHNRLLTLPADIHFLSLKALTLHGNLQLRMPPKPTDRASASYYNVDFSLETQLRMAGQLQKAHATTTSASSIASSTKSYIQRKKEFLQRRRLEADQSNADKVIKGMSKIAGATAEMKEREDDFEGCLALAKPQTWKENMTKARAKLDFSDIFDPEVGRSAGLWVWEIDMFYPCLVDPEYHGTFFIGDTYLILKTTLDTTGQLKHDIYYWIGAEASIDRKMCAAMFSVNLSSFVHSTKQNIRVEQFEESDDFIDLFGGKINICEGSQTTTGFYSVVKKEHKTRLYRASVTGTSVDLEPVPVSVESLDPRYCFLLDTEKTMWVWSGRKCALTIPTKVRLFAQHINTSERKCKMEVESCSQRSTPEEFWLALTGSPNVPEEPIVEIVPENLVLPKKILYNINIVNGFIEITQVELVNGILKKDMLKPKQVHLLECHNDLYLWTSVGAGRVLKMSGQRVLQELFTIITRPPYGEMIRENEGTESIMFKSKFEKWTDVAPVDYTKAIEGSPKVQTTAKSPQKSKEPMKVDLVHLFLERHAPLSEEQNNEKILDDNADLTVFEGFVLAGSKFKRLPQEEYGTFYTKDCYVFLCRYNIYASDEESEAEDEYKDQNETKDVDLCVVYFWQGRDAQKMGFYKFTYGLQPKFEELFKDRLEVIRMSQQQENSKFLSHFNKKFVIRTGSRGNPPSDTPELFHMRANGSSAYNRTIQIKPRAKYLCSGFCYILRVPKLGENGTIYVWVGRKTKMHEPELANTIASENIRAAKEEIIFIKEGEEPDDFWKALKGKKEYVTDCTFMEYTRLFRCTNERGFFAVSEKTIDFCQDDLDEDDVMILDTGKFLYLWPGPRASEVELKLAHQAIQTYKEYLDKIQPHQQRKLRITLKGRESLEFTICFHGWSHFRPTLN